MAALKGTRRLIAFLGRYGGQPAWWCYRQPISDLISLAHEVGELLAVELDKLRGRVAALEVEVELLRDRVMELDVGDGEDAA